MTRPDARDVVVVGGGMIGLSVAHQAASRGLKVLLLERDEPGRGAGRAAAGMLAPVSEAEAGDQALMDLALESCRLYPDFVARVEKDAGIRCGYRAEGTMLVALNRDHAGELERLAAFHRRLGLQAEVLTGREVLAREPAVTPRAVGGLFAPGDRQVDPRRLQEALIAAIVHRGGAIVTNARLAGVETAASKVAAVSYTSQGRPHSAETSAVVLAAGAWMPGLPIQAARALPIRPIKGEIIRLRGKPIIDHVVRTPDVYLVPREDGEIVVGATAEDVGFDGRPTAGAAFELLREAFRVLPGIAELELAEQTVGFRPALRDALPAIGPVAPQGLFVAGGHYRHGVMLAAATARLLVDCLTTGEVPALLSPFDPARFAVASPVSGGLR